jgi:sugar phosphate isomerase/epimerase
MPTVTLGAHTFGFVWNCLADEAFERLAEAGFRHVQLMATAPHYDPWAENPELTRRLRSILDRHGVSLLALDLASSDINLASPSADVVDFAVDAYARGIDRAAELGAKWICVGSGRRHALLTKANDRLMETFRPAFARIHAKAQQRGIGIILENHPQGLLADASTIAGFLDAEGYASIPVIYDVANAFAINEDPVAGLATLWSRLGIIHLSDSARGQWRHDPIATGAIDFSAIAAMINDRAFEGAVVLEILSDAPLHGLTDGVAKLRTSGFTFQDTIKQAS